MSSTNNNRDGQGTSRNTKDRPKRESILDLNKFLNKEVHIKFQGGRESKGTLRGYDQFLNLVIENATDFQKDSDHRTRKFPLVVCRGPAVTAIHPEEGHEAIENPFITSG